MQGLPFAAGEGRYNDLVPDVDDTVAEGMQGSASSASPADADVMENQLIGLARHTVTGDAAERIFRAADSLPTADRPIGGRVHILNVALDCADFQTQARPAPRKGCT
jgi:hypothetical protein